MSNGPGIWIGAVVASIAVNVGAGAGLLAALLPSEIPEQPMPESRLNVEAQEVTRSDAAEQVPESSDASQGEVAVATLGAGAIAQSRAAAQVVEVEMSDPVAPQAEASNEVAPVGEKTAAAEIELTAVNSAAVPVSQAVSGARLVPVKAATAQPTNVMLPQAKLTAVNTPTTQPTTQSAVPEVPKLETTLQQDPDAPEAIAVAPVVLAGLRQEPSSLAAPEQTPDVTRGKAKLAFPGGDGSSIDPVSVAAFQSFTQSGALSADTVRDGVNDALSVPCSRMQVTFDPDSTTLRLNGHIPTKADRAPVLAALQARMGEDIAVADNLLILPAPQCAALSGIASVGLPQSTDQITNPLIVGADTHARAFRYVKDQPLVIELTAPDYPAYVYVDYFDADGNVIHLSPNERAPLQEAAEKSALQIGARNAQEAGLYVVIGPPYGQEIAVAFASSIPLYDGLRPLVEPADAYLEWMKGQVAVARAADPAFKGEWVYFFVTTAAQ